MRAASPRQRQSRRSVPVPVVVVILDRATANDREVHLDAAPQHVIAGIAGQDVVSVTAHQHVVPRSVLRVLQRLLVGG